jgi:hypothetical protein
MKRAAGLQAAFTEEGDRDRLSLPRAQPGRNVMLWVIVLTLPVLTIALFIAIGILGLLVRLFGA